MTRTFSFEMTGTAAKGQTWKTAGIVVDDHNDFPGVFDAAMRGTFQQLTNGEAVFGQPGVGCCSGPYDIKRVVIEQASKNGN